MDQEIERLLKKRQNGYFSENDQIRLQELIDSNAEIEEFVRASIPIFGNCITITDFELRILVNCDVVEVNEKQIISISGSG